MIETLLTGFVGGVAAWFFKRGFRRNHHDRQGIARCCLPTEMNKTAHRRPAT